MSRLIGTVAPSGIRPSPRVPGLGFETMLGMDVWVWSAGIGVMLGLGAFFLVLVPVLAWQYRRFGRLSKRRLLGTAALSVYVAAIMSYTWLPLPPTDPSWCAVHGIDGVQLRPLAFLEDIGAEIAAVGPRAALTSTVTLQVVFNVVFFIPWGAIVRGFLGTSVLTATVTGFLASLLVEATQATGLWFIYPCAYRLGDIDDLLTNTAGALIGALIAPLVLFWMPRADGLAASRLEPRPVTAWRRWGAMLITWMSVTLLTGVGVLAVRVGFALFGEPVSADREAWSQFAVHALVVIGLLYVPALRGRGSIGLAVVWLAPVWRRPSGQLTLGNPLLRLVRASVLGLPWILTAVPGWELAGGVFSAAVLVSVVLVPLTRTRRSLSGVIARNEIADIRSAAVHAAVSGRRSGVR